MSAAVLVLPQVWATDGCSDLRTGAVLPVLILRPALRPQPEVNARRAVVVRPELAFYRKYTEAILMRYVSMSMEAGRVPSLLGREMFRGKITNYRVNSFEDVVIFVTDVERCLAKLDDGQQTMIRRISLQKYTQAETASMLGIGRQTVIRHHLDALDRLTRIFLDCRLLEPDRLRHRTRSELSHDMCQGGEAH